MSEGLDSGEKKALRSADRSVGVANLEWLRKYQLRRGRLIGLTNRYLDGDRRLGVDLTNGAVRKKDVGLYVAASAILHCSDSWSYVGHALDALGRGDQAAATHLGYYASLRASLSLLASEGFGAFNRNHVVASPPPWTTSPVAAIRKRGTHEVAWLALDQWASYRRSGDLLGDVITPAGILLADWMTDAGGEQWRPVARGWLKLWGADLKQFARDQRLRNRASYRPQSDTTGTNPPPEVAFIAAVWAVIDPRPGRLFARLDLELLRLALESAFQGRKDRPARNDPEFISETKLIVESNGLGEDEYLQPFLTRKVAPDDSQIITTAQRRTPVGSISTAVEVISRSVLLLRIATGATRRMVDEAGLDDATLKFWWLNLLRARGMLGDAEPPDDLVELWDDVAPALEAAQTLVAADLPKTQMEWMTGHATEHVSLTGFERATVVGLLA